MVWQGLEYLQGMINYTKLYIDLHTVLSLKEPSTSKTFAWILYMCTTLFHLHTEVWIPGRSKGVEEHSFHQLILMKRKQQYAAGCLRTNVIAPWIWSSVTCAAVDHMLICFGPSEQNNEVRGVIQDYTVKTLGSIWLLFLPSQFILNWCLARVTMCIYKNKQGRRNEISASILYFLYSPF